MGTEDVKQVAESLRGRKGKTKRLDSLPTNTKAKKLPRSVQQGIKEALGTDLSKVRVHTGGNTAEMCRDLKARAFVSGKDIFLARPSDAANEKLLAHELTHAIQQSANRVPKSKPGKVLVSK